MRQDVMDENHASSLASAVLDPEHVGAVRRRLESLVHELKGLLSDITAGRSDLLVPGERQIASRYAVVKTNILDAHRRAAFARKIPPTAAELVYWEPAVHEAAAHLRARVHSNKRQALAESVSSTLETLRDALTKLEACRPTEPSA
jgi:hypothetical protein